MEEDIHKNIFNAHDIICNLDLYENLLEDIIIEEDDINLNDLTPNSYKNEFVKSGLYIEHIIICDYSYYIFNIKF